ncbi:FAD/NAD(P)-binding domain-containing protein [Trametes cingulata]|nr:FAD/NAD(P)-binding domain-containing protein [Trametes cingulata]
MSGHDEKRVAAGLKAAIHNPNVSEEAKERAQERLENMGASVDTGSRGGNNNGGSYPAGTTDEAGRETNRVLGGYKATLHNPRTSEGAKQHAREILEADGYQVDRPEGMTEDEHQKRVNAGYKAALHNPRVSEEAKQHAREYLEQHGGLSLCAIHCTPDYIFLPLSSPAASPPPARPLYHPRASFAVEPYLTAAPGLSPYTHPQNASRSHDDPRCGPLATTHYDPFTLTDDTTKWYARSSAGVSEITRGADKSTDTAQRTPDFLPIEFIVVGGAISGLTAAIALSRVGHKVTVLEVMETFHETPMGAGCRIPPNATKLFYRWGMEERLRKCSVKSRGILFATYDSGSVVGSHEWEEEVLEETGGDFLLTHYSDLRRILAESAAEHGAKLRGGCHVVSVKPDATRPSVTLANGEVLTADVVVGADGCHVPPYHCRRIILEALEQEDTEKPTGMQLYNVLLPDSALNELEDKELLGQLRQTGKVFTWFGPGYGALGFPVKEPTTGEPLFTLFVYAARKDQDITVVNAGREQLLESLKGCDSRLVQLARQAREIICIPMVERPFLEDWVHPDGRVIAIGEAAHPIPAGSLYALGMAAGDAAVLGRLFSHLHRKDQIASFLNAVPEIRAGRVERVLRAAEGNIFAVSLPPGVAEARNRALRERAERGIEHLARAKGGVGAQTSEEMMQAIEDIFAYDPEDEADNWWVQWGLMQERAARMVVSDSVTVHVNEDLQEESE